MKSPEKAERLVSSFDAKTHLAQLIQAAENGQTFVITRRGKPVARLVPFEAREIADFGELAAEFRQFRSEISGRMNIQKLRDEGRKY